MIERDLGTYTARILQQSTVKRGQTATLKKTKIGFQYQLSLNAGQKYCRMHSRMHSAILSTFITLPFVNKTFVLSILIGRLTPGLLTCILE